MEIFSAIQEKYINFSWSCKSTVSSIPDCKSSTVIPTRSNYIFLCFSLGSFFHSHPCSACENSCKFDLGCPIEESHKSHMGQSFKASQIRLSFAFASIFIANISYCLGVSSIAKCTVKLLQFFNSICILCALQILSPIKFNGHSKMKIFAKRARAGNIVRVLFGGCCVLLDGDAIIVISNWHLLIFIFQLLFGRSCWASQKW